MVELNRVETQRSASYSLQIHPTECQVFARTCLFKVGFLGCVLAFVCMFVYLGICILAYITMNHFKNMTLSHTIHTGTPSYLL